MIIANIFTLLVAFQIKHFFADYPMQTPYMLQKFKADWGFLMPLVAHCGVHAGLTFAIVWIWYWNHPVNAWVLLALPTFDFVVHFVMDRIKAGPKYLGRFEAISKAEYHYYKDKTNRAQFNAAMKSNKYFWWSLGLDQKVHHLTHYVIIYFLITWRV